MSASAKKIQGHYYGQDIAEVKELRKFEGDYCYRVENHKELFRLGESFYEDYRQGIKSFAITSTGYFELQRKTILGLASYFDHKNSGLSILIATHGLSSETFKEVIDSSEQEDFEFHIDVSRLKGVGVKSVKVKFYTFFEHFHFVDFNDLTKLRVELTEKEYLEVLDEVVSSYNVTFWDLPEVSDIQGNLMGYFPIISKFHSLSMVIRKEETGKTEIERVKGFFENYGLDFKGAIIDSQVESKDKKKPWWKVWR